MRNQIRLGALVIIAGTLVGCGAKTETWQETTKEQFTPAQAQGLQKAEQAREALFNQLKSRLTEAIGAEGPAGAIGVCSDEAPRIARAVAQQFGVEIGRTSFKTRNPANAPPAWAQRYVDEQTGEPVYLEETGSGRIAALLPIRMQPECMLCHGPSESIPEDVRGLLKELYPEDQATGFQLGELRGWFHIVAQAG
jgi:hypothetical protein